MRKEKGEISVGMIIAIIIVIVSLVILALTYYQMVKENDLDRQTCQTSAMMRGTIPDSIPESQIKDLVQLKCKTKKICVTTNVIQKGECQEEFGSLEGKYSTYRISNNKEKAEKQIKTLLAREMADCWDMLGRGAYQIFKRELTAKNAFASYGVICSRIKFDKTVTDEKNGPQIKELTRFNEYLLRYKHPNMNVSYWDFLRNSYDGETMNILFGQSISGSQTSSNKNQNNLEEFFNVKVNLTKTQAIMYVEASPTAIGPLIGASVGGLIGTIVGANAGSHLFNGFFIGGSVGWGAGDFVQMKMLNWDGLFPEGSYAASIFLIDYTMESFEKFNRKANFQIASIS